MHVPRECVCPKQRGQWEFWEKVNFRISDNDKGITVGLQKNATI